MFERFTQSARRAIFLCRLEAMQRGASEISTADLFLGLIQEPAEAEPAVAALQTRTPEFRQLLSSPTPDSGADPNLPLSSDSKRALALAATKADNDQSSEITRDHLLHGILHANDSTARKLHAAGL